MIVRFTADASQEILDITRHYAALNRDIGCRFIDRMDEVLAALSIYPAMGLPITNVFRRVLLRQFPYAVYYRIDSASGSIWIETVIHQRRQADYWRNRVQEAPALYAVAA